MLPFGIGFSEVLLILVVLLLVVGPQKLPELARTLGKGVRAARRASQELRDAIELDEIRQSVYDHTVRPWQQATDIEDAEVDDRGTYARAAAEVAAATRAAVDGVDPATADNSPGECDDRSAEAGDAATAFDDAADPDEQAPSGPIARGPGPIMPAPRPERPADPEPDTRSGAPGGRPAVDAPDGTS